MKKLYQYTVYRADGTISKLDPQPKLDYREIYKLINCSTFQLVPTVYFPKSISKRATAFCDEEGLFKQPLIANPFFVPYTDKLFGDTSRIFGDVLVQEVYHA